MEVRDGYAISMKQAIVDYRRLDAAEEEKMAELKLPPVAVKPVPPYLAVVATPERQLPIGDRIFNMEQGHFTVRCTFCC